MKSLVGLALGFAAVFYVTGAEAALRITKTYAFPVAKYEQVEAAIAEAAARSPEEMKSVYRKTLDAGDRSSIMCLAGSPKASPVGDGKGWGCLMTFTTDLGNGATLESSQMLYLTKTSADIRKLLADKDTNQNSFIDLGSIFDGGDGSQYFCDSANGAWDCKLKMVSASR